ncbi:MAG: HD domain-containing protein [Ignavibacteriales bacterium]|nr:HD domain-containing protein [Ignavibacteriales bacterium]
MKLEIHNTILKKIGSIADELFAEVYVVGGYVRDLLLGREVNDIDIVVVGDGVLFAENVAGRLGKKKVVTFEKFGTAMLPYENGKIEFVGARRESYNRDSRKPDVAVGTLQEDLSRRDFTINAMAVSLNKSRWGELVDPFHGQDDLDKKIIRTPLDPMATFDDDPLRIMRAIRFAAQKGFSIDEKTLAAIPQIKERLTIISQERITDEFMKILASPKPSIGLRLMFDTGIMAIVFQEVAELSGVDQRKDHHHKDVFLHTCQVLDNISTATENIYLRLAALLHDIAKPKTKKFIEEIGWTFHGHEEIGARMVKHIFRKLKLPLEHVPYVEKIVRLHQRPMQLVDGTVTDSAIRRLLFEAGEEVDDLMTLCRADITSKNPKLVQQYSANYDVVYQKMKEVEEKDKLRAFQPPVRGDEIMRICNLPPGKLVGILKMEIEEAILEGRIPNEHDPALEYLLSIKDEIMKKYTEEGELK